MTTAFEAYPKFNYKDWKIKIDGVWITKDMTAQNPKAVKVKKAKRPLRPVNCMHCGKFTGQFSRMGTKKLTHTSCGCGKVKVKSFSDNAHLDNDIVIKHRKEADEHINDLGEEYLGCSVCKADTTDDCICCQVCMSYPYPEHAKMNHKYVPSGKNIRAQMKDQVGK